MVTLAGVLYFPSVTLCVSTSDGYISQMNFIFVLSDRFVGVGWDSWVW